MATPAQIYAVLMGDLVDSEGSDSPADLNRVFDQVVTGRNAASAGVLASPLTITLGDEFQGLVRSLVDAWEIAGAVRLELLDRGIDCRLALGLVTLQTPLNAERAWNMMGPGLSGTRATLNEKRAANHYRFALPHDPVLQTMLEAAGTTLTAIEGGWTETQRRDIHALLDGETAAGIARRRKVSVHTVYKVRGSGQFDLYVTQRDAIRAALAAIDAAHGLPNT